MLRKYIKPNFSNGYPSAKDIFYECKVCDDVIISNPTKSLQCSCHNIIIDADYGRMVIKDESMVRVFESDEKSNQVSLIHNILLIPYFN
jgi:hypothetical protein